MSKRRNGVKKILVLGVMVGIVISQTLSGGGWIPNESVKVNAAATEQKTAAKETTRTYINENINAQNYTYPFHPEIIGSYLEPVDNGYMRVQKYNTADVLIEYYDEAFTYVSNQSIPSELPIFGGFYAGEEFYYLVWGKENLKESDSNEVIRVVKYTKKWERISQCSVYGANTTTPFDSGLVRMTECNGYLFVRTTHEMYTSDDGLNHQANLSLQIRTEDMEITNSAYGVTYNVGYVSHCFNTFIMADDTNHILALDQGDAYPRGSVLGRYKNIPGENCLTGGCQQLVTFEYQGDIGQNTTKATLGGFEYSDTSILVAGTSIAQDENYKLDYTQNLYLAVTDRKELEDTSNRNKSMSQTTTMRWLTNFKEDGKFFHHCATTPRLVKWDNNLFLLIWSETEYDEPTGKLYYEFIDGTGKQIGEIHSEKGDISDCQPIMKDNKVVWYTTDNKNLCFYSIDKEGKLTKKKVSYPKQVDVFPKSISECRLAVTKIGELKVSEIDRSYVVTFRGETLKLGEDYDVRGEWVLKNGNVVNQFGKVIYGCSGNFYGRSGDFYGEKEFEVGPIRKDPILKSVTSTSSMATVKWEKESGCMGYVVYRSVNGAGKKKVATITDSAICSWKDKTIKKGNCYSYSIKAYTKKGTKTIYTNSTNEMTVLPGNPKAFVKPKNVLAKRKGNKVTITATKNKTASGYEYQFSHDYEFSTIQKKKLSSSNKITLTLKDAYYVVRVRVYRKIKGKKVYGAWSSPCSFV